MSGRIAVLVPSRGRPHNIERLWATAVDAAADPDSVDLYVRLDHDDQTVHDYLATGVPAHLWSIGHRNRLAASWNELAATALRDERVTHLALWGDDVIPECTGWDDMARERTERDGPGWVYGPDGIWDHSYGQQIEGHLVLPTATIVSREIVEALGWVSPPGVLQHLCIDLVWRDLGLALGCLFYEPQMRIRHLHRLAGAPDDATYQEANDGPQASDDHRNYSRWHASTDFSAALARLQEGLERARAVRDVQEEQAPERYVPASDALIIEAAEG